MDKQKVWNETLGVIKVSVSGANFSTWFAQTFIVSIKKITDGRQLVEVGFPSSFAAKTAEERYFGLLQDALNQVTGFKNDLSFSVKQRPKKNQNNDGVDAPLFLEKKKEDRGEEVLRSARIRPGFSFDNFAVSSTNQMAWAAADVVSKNLGKAYNPLFLWGGVGVGKTHLMLAIGNRVLSQDPGERATFCMGEEFTTEIIEAIRTRTTAAFKKRYRTLGLLMIDDVQFLAGKMSVQEEFFHTFNTLQRQGGQIVLTSDVPPSDIPKLENRLRSRFEAGLIVDVPNPDFELRTAIVLIKAKEGGIPVSMESAQKIAASLESARKIEGFLVLLLSEIRRNATAGVEELIEKNLNRKNHGGEALKTKLSTPQDFISGVANYFSLGKQKLLGQNRSRPVSVPRQILMYLLRVELGLPLQEVGRLTGGRDHTTVIHGVDKISKSLSTNERLREDLLGIKRSISG